MLRILIVLLSMSLAGCIGNPSRTDSQLADTLRQFEAVVRWGDLRKMYAFVRPAANRVVEIPEGLEQFRVISYEALSRPAEVAPGRWTQSIAIEYVHRDRQVVKGMVSHQTWEKDPDGGRWYLVTPPPLFR